MTEDRGSQLRPAWAIEWQKKTAFQKASEQIKKHCFPSKDSRLFQLTSFLVYVCERENYSMGFSYRQSVPWNTSLLLPLARRPRIRVLSVRTELAPIAFWLHEYSHSLAPGFFSFSLSSPFCYNTRFQVHMNELCKGRLRHWRVTQLTEMAKPNQFPFFSLLATRQITSIQWCYVPTPSSGLLQLLPSHLPIFDGGNSPYSHSSPLGHEKSFC